MQLATVTFAVDLPPDYLRLEQLVMGELKLAGDETAEALADLVRLHITTPDADGRVIDSSHDLLNSVQEDAQLFADHIVIEVWSEQAHAEYVEDGRPAGPVPVAAIIEWMLEKGISPRNGDTLAQAAHAIAHHIMTTGFAARHPFAHSLEEADAIAIEAIDRAQARLNARLN